MEEFFRNCPDCNSKIEYKKREYKQAADKKGSLCKKCSMRELSNRPEIKEKSSRRMSGDKNPGYDGKIWKNRRHTQESIEKMRESKKILNPKFQTEEFKNKISELTSGEKNPMYGKSFYEIWVEKLGKDKADDRLKELKNNLKNKFSGCSNPMYGKVPSKNSGSGWNGWYNGIFFRSLHELTFLVNWVGRFNLDIESAEVSDLAIDYKFKGSSRKYFADWLINKKYLVEIKPAKLIKTELNSAKFKYANEFCQSHNLIFKVIDPGIIHIESFLKLYKEEKVILTDKTKTKLEKFLSNAK
jgi:hypothetical protein